MYHIRHIFSTKFYSGTDDYTEIMEAIVFDSGSENNATLCINITINDDTIFEDNETFSVILTTSDPAVLIENNQTAITITDNDSKCCHQDSLEIFYFLYSVY